MHYNDFLNKLTMILSNQMDITYSDAQAIIDRPDIRVYEALKKAWKDKKEIETVVEKIINDTFLE